MTGACVVDECIQESEGRYDDVVVGGGCGKTEAVVCYEAEIDKVYVVCGGDECECTHASHSQWIVCSGV